MFFFIFFLGSYNSLMPMHFILIYLFLNLLFSKFIFILRFHFHYNETKNEETVLHISFNILALTWDADYTLYFRSPKTCHINNSKISESKKDNEWEQSRRPIPPKKRRQKFYFQFSHWNQPITCIPFWIRIKWKSNYKFNTE